MSNEAIQGYKGFDKNLKCREFQFAIGSTFKQDGKIKACENGFHFCENPLDIFDYYPPANSRYCAVEGSGELDKGNGKTACSVLKVKAEIGLPGLIKAGVEYIKSRVNWDNAKVTSTGDCSVATNTSDYSAATSSGCQSAATNIGRYSVATSSGCQSAATNIGRYSVATSSGYHSAATNTGDYSVATNTSDYSAATNIGRYSVATSSGCQSAATNIGRYSVATSSGYHSAATNTGDYSVATNTGEYSAATNVGDYSTATNTGCQSVATNTGEYSAASVEGQESVAAALGIEGRAKGAKGCWIVLAEWTYDKEKYKWHRVDVQCFYVDDEKIKADTYYMLKDGVLTEWEA